MPPFLLMVICSWLIMETLTNLNSSSLRAFAVPWHTFASSVVNAFANIVPLVLLVPLYGAIGAALALVVQFAIMFVVSGWILRRSIALKYDWLALQKMLSASVLATLAGLGCLAWLGIRARVLVPAGLA